MTRLALLFSALAGVVYAGKSSGCGKDAPYDLDKLTEESLESGGTNRTYLVNLPKKYESGTAAPLILSFHGALRTMTDQSQIDDFTNSTWNSDKIVVYPQGKDSQWENAPYATNRVDDVQFTADLIGNLSESLCIDTSRIYCSGKSIGGGFCHMLACDEDLSSQFAAIAPVSGAYYTTPADKSWSDNCKPSHQMPVLEFHGKSDGVISYDGGDRFGVDLLSIPAWAKDWAVQDGCSDKDSPVASHFNNSKVLLASYSCNSSERVVQHYAIDDLGHTWPSTGKTIDNGGSGTYIDASPIILEFFGNWTLDDTTSSSTTSSSGSASSTPTSTKTGSGSKTSATSSSSTGGAAMATMVPGLMGAMAIGAMVL